MGKVETEVGLFVDQMHDKFVFIALSRGGLSGQSPGPRVPLRAKAE